MLYSIVPWEVVALLGDEPVCPWADLAVYLEDPEQPDDLSEFDTSEAAAAGRYPAGRPGIPSETSGAGEQDATRVLNRANEHQAGTHWAFFSSGARP
ncbi:MAG: hypothetical protein IMX01_07930 [Limnochordaceae bacterium]|nr:hypothetical protein [Limnochordaceae bacterium]